MSSSRLDRLDCDRTWCQREEDPSMTVHPTESSDSAAEAAQPAGIGRRFVARVVDFVILAVLGLVLGVALDFGFAWLVIQAVMVFAYFVLLDVFAGTTPGKLVMGLRVTGPDGGRPTMREALVREAFTLLGAIPFAGPVLALAAWVVIAVTINSSPTNRGKHDELAGGTRVVLTREVGR
jgi:uncharacterized RDD family membrane protein YckC